MEIIWSCAMRLDVLIKLILLNNTFAFLAISTILKHRTVFIIFGSCYCVARCAHNRPYFIFCYTPKSASFVLVTSMLRFRSMHVHHRYLILAFICYFNVLIFTIFFPHQNRFINFLMQWGYFFFSLCVLLLLVKCFSFLLIHFTIICIESFSLMFVEFAQRFQPNIKYIYFFHK